MQRWAAQKIATARKQGSVKSGAGHATGMVFEDRVVSRGMAPNQLKPITERAEIVGTATRYGVHYYTVTPKLKRPNGTVACTLAEPREDTTVSACAAHKAARRAYLKHGNRR